MNSENKDLIRRLLRQDVVLVAVAIVTGAAGAMLAGRYLSTRAQAAEEAAARRYETRPVVVAAVDMAAGERLDHARLAAREMPAAFVPADAVSPADVQALLGADTRIAIRRGSPVVAGAVRQGVAAAHLAALLSENERALTLPVDEVNSQAGAMRTGDRVDLYFTRNASGEAVLAPLLEHVEILATGASLLGDSPESAEGFAAAYATVTLRVGVDDAARVLLAQQAGQITLLLRATADSARGPLRIRRSSELLQVRGGGTARPAARVELLVGGAGAETPVRSWLDPQRSATPTAGDRT